MKRKHHLNKLTVFFVFIFIVFSAVSVNAAYQNALEKKYVKITFSPLLDPLAFNITEINLYHTVAPQILWEKWWGPFLTTFTNGWIGKYTTYNGAFVGADWVKTGEGTSSKASQQAS